MKKIISLAVITLLIVQFTTCKKSDKIDSATINNDGIINFLTGDVSIVLNDNTEKANVGDKIIQGMTILTGTKSVVDIYFESCVIRVLENSSVAMKELIKNLADNKELTELYVKNGKMFTQVTRKLTEKEKFKISTPTSVAGVRGTEFLVDEDNGKSKISCVEGTVAVRDALEDDSSFIDVENGKAASIESGKPITVDDLSEEEINNIKKIKDDIRGIREDIRHKFEEQREEIRQKVIDQKSTDKSRVEEQKESDKANVEAIKDTAKTQVEEIKGNTEDTKQNASDAVSNFEKPDISGVKPDVKNFKNTVKSE
ncbi:MAG: FecR family protein [Leptospirales bacterium]|nr:FecR family protein [Leptospirales bacterium]